MFWIIQDSMYREEGMQELVRTLERFNIPFCVVEVKDGQITPDVQPENPVFVCGTYSLSRIAKERGWFPGSFANENHEHSQWIKHYGERMLNYHAHTCEFKDIDVDWIVDKIFIRPSEDNKFFNGQVLDKEEILDWKAAIVTNKPSPVRCSLQMNANTLVTYGPTVDIYREYRFFIVDKKIVASTTYRVGQDVVAMETVDPIAFEFAAQTVKIWQPARGFVLDIALTTNSCKVVEINCLNMAGFYGANVQALVEAIENMEFDQALNCKI